ncbi:MAG: glycosyltransferase family 9 protein [Verrucomicrobiota bacterium]
MRLLIFKVNQLGDNVVFLPVVQQIARQHPQWHITVCTSPVAAPLYHTACPGVEVLEFITRDFNAAWRRPWDLLALGRRFMAASPDLCLLGNDQGNVAHLLAWLSAAKQTAGPFVRERYLGRLLHHRVPSDFSQPDPQKNWSIARAVVPDLPDDIPPPDLSAFGRDAHGGVFIHAGASRDYKKWPLANYIHLANRLSAHSKVVWMNQDAAEENMLVPEVRRLSQGTLADLIRQIAGARLFIGNNSGPMNLASALGTPGIIFNGPSTSAWDPFWHRDQFELLRDPTLACQPCDSLSGPADACFNTVEPMACMKRWSVDRVHGLVMNKLG